MNWLDHFLTALAACAAGAVNALAGGGTLITFPALVALGVPAISANVTSTVALCPGYFGATLAQWNDLRDQGSRLRRALPAAVLGGLAGGYLLLHTGDRVFHSLVPFLLLGASGLLAGQGPVRRWLTREPHAHSLVAERWMPVPVALAALYGGYFGAGLSVIILASLGLLVNDSLTRLNAVKQALAFSVNVAAAIFFLFSGRVLWMTALIMAGGALLGGILGGKLAGRISPVHLRWTVVSIGTVVGLIYLSRL